MTMINPIANTENIHEQYAQFFKTEYALDNKELAQKLDELFKNNFLWKPPYISITQNFESGKQIDDFVDDLGLSKEIVEATKILRFYKHQELAIENIVKNGRSTIISSGTGSGKTEIFLIPIFEECSKYDGEVGIKAIIVYPMNALANDQVDRIRDYLFPINQKRKAEKKKEITFGIYTGETPNTIYDSSESTSQKFRTDIKTKCPSCGKYELHLATDGINSFFTCNNEEGLRIDYQIPTRSELKANPPDILVTNYMQLEYLLLRDSDKPLWNKNMIKFIVLDEIHAYGGAKGVDVSLLLRRLKNRIENTSTKKSIIFVGTSATISKAPSESERKKAISEFATKLFGIEFYPEDVIEGKKEKLSFPSSSKLNKLEILENEKLTLQDLIESEFAKLCSQIEDGHVISGSVLPDQRSEYLGSLLLKNEFFQFLVTNLNEPKSTEELRELVLNEPKFSSKLAQNDAVFVDRLIWSFLRSASLSRNSLQKKDEPLIRVTVHNFFRGVSPLYMCTNPKCKKVFGSPKDSCDNCGSIIEELSTCRDCGKEFLISDISKDDLDKAALFTYRNEQLAKANRKEEQPTLQRLHKTSNSLERQDVWFTFLDGEKKDEDLTDHLIYKKCLHCGSFSPDDVAICKIKNNEGDCNSKDFVRCGLFVRNNTKGERIWRPHECPYCGGVYGGRGNIITKFDMSPKQAGVNLFNLVYDCLENKKLLIFTDNRQNAASLAGYLDFAHDDTAFKQLIVKKLDVVKNRDGVDYVSLPYFLHDELIHTIEGDWYNYKLDDFERNEDEIVTKILEEFTNKKRKSLERLGLIEINYRGLEKSSEFRKIWESIVPSYKFSTAVSDKVQKIIYPKGEDPTQKLNKFLIRLLHMMRQEGALFGLENPDYLSRTKATGFTFDKNATKIDNSQRGIKIIPINLKSLKFYRYAKRVFGFSEDHEPVQLLEAAWYFFRKGGFVVETGLAKGFSKKIRGFVVAQNKVLISAPTSVQKCSKCLKIYTNSPTENCPNEISRRSCKGKLTTFSFDEFSKNNKSHFFNLFKTGEPSRMATTENTGALTSDHRKRIQTGFLSEDPKERTVDVTVCTPTLELGVDIGDLSAIGQFKSPPSPIHYLQRVGRAGRRDGIAFINTFFFNNPIDEFHFQHPGHLIQGTVEPPQINFENNDLINRHINAVILEEILINADQTSNEIPKKINDFIQKDEYLENLINQVKNKKESISHNIRKVLYDVGNYKKDYEVSDRLINYLQTKFTNDVKESLNYYRNELNACNNGIDEYTKHGTKSYTDTIKLRDLYLLKKELERKSLLEHFFNTGILPRYAFPGIMVRIETLRGESFQGRPRNIAITEYAPNCEITLKKRIYRSCGIDVDEKAVEHFYICKSCRRFYSKSNWKGTACPFCGVSEEPEQIRSIAPKKIYLEERSNSVNEFQNYTEPNVEIYLEDNKMLEPPKIRDYPSFQLQIANQGTVRMLQNVAYVYTEYEDVNEDDEDDVLRDKHEILICTECGRAKRDSRFERHRPLTQRFRQKNKFCSGSFEPLALHHEMMTNLITISVSSKQSQELSPINDKKFLTTLKNAIIFASQLIVEAEEGEIEGEIKSNEIILYDNVDGGAGYVKIIYKKIDEILQRANEIISSEYKNYGEECDHGCLRCLWSFRRKRDIPNIDKQKILPLLFEIATSESYEENESFDDKENEKPTKPKIDIVASEPASMKGIEKIKDFLRGANKEIAIFSPVLSERWLDFGEGRKSWLDVLGSIKGGEKNVGLKVYTLKHQNESDVKSLLRLYNDGIEVYEIEQKEELDAGLLDTSLIVIDPFSTEGRMVIRISNNLTEQMFVNNTIIQTTNNESEVKSALKEFEKIKRLAKIINEKECERFTGFSIYEVKAGDKISIDKAVTEFKKIVQNAKEVKVSDPHLQSKQNHQKENLSHYVDIINGMIPQNCSVKIITANHPDAEISNAKRTLESYSHQTEIVSFQTEQTWKRLPILHKRFVIVDDSIVILMDKGLRLLYDQIVYGTSNSDTHISISAKKANVDQQLAVFNKNWDYQSNPILEIKNCPTMDTRSTI